MRLLWREFRYGWRGLRQSPGFAALAILTLAVGIAANTTVFSWIHAVLLSPLPGTHAGGRLVAVESNERSGEGHNISVPGLPRLPRSLEVARRDHSNVGSASFLRRAARSPGACPWRNGGIRLLPGAGSARGTGSLVRGQGVRRPGRLVSRGCDRRPLLAQVFPCRRRVVGRAMRVNGHAMTVIGVTSPEFEGQSGASMRICGSP